MSDTNTRSELLRAGKPIHIGGVTLLPIEHVAMQYSDIGVVGAWISAAMQPYALIVRDAAGIRTVDIGAAVSLGELREKIPGLDVLLTTL